jgi:hypothetical protein
MPAFAVALLIKGLERVDSRRALRFVRSPNGVAAICHGF